MPKYASKPHNRDFGPHNRDFGPHNRDFGAHNRDFGAHNRDMNSAQQRELTEFKALKNQQIAE